MIGYGLGVWMAAILGTPSTISAAGPVVEVAGMVSSTDANIGGAMHCFGGREVEIPLRIMAGAGWQLDVCGRLYQLSTGLAAQLGEDVEIVTAETLGESARMQAVCAWQLPPVEHETEFDARFYVRVYPDPLWHAAGHQRLLVYPTNLLAPVRTMAAWRPVAVVDETDKLTAFLKKECIGFRDAERFGWQEDAAGNKGPADLVLYVPASSVTVAEPAWPEDVQLKKLLDEAACLVLFLESADSLRHVVVKQGAGQLRLEVRMPLLDRLTEDPAAQRTFVRIMELSMTEQAREGTP